MSIKCYRLHRYYGRGGALSRANYSSLSSPKKKTVTVVLQRKLNLERHFVTKHDSSARIFPCHQLKAVEKKTNVQVP